MSENNRTVVADRIVAYLRQLYPTKTAESVAADTLISQGTVQKWLDRGSAPGVIALLALAAAYGPPLLAAAYLHPPDWLDQAARAARQHELEAQLATIRAQLDAL